MNAQKVKNEAWGCKRHYQSSPYPHTSFFTNCQRVKEHIVKILERHRRIRAKEEEVKKTSALVGFIGVIVLAMSGILAGLDSKVAEGYYAPPPTINDGYLFGGGFLILVALALYQDSLSKRFMGLGLIFLLLQLFFLRG